MKVCDDVHVLAFLLGLQWILQLVSMTIEAQATLVGWVKDSGSGREILIITGDSLVVTSTHYNLVFVLQKSIPVNLLINALHCHRY